MVGHHGDILDAPAVLDAHLLEHLAELNGDSARQDRLATLRAPDEMVLDKVYAMRLLLVLPSQLVDSIPFINTQCNLRGPMAQRAQSVGECIGHGWSRLAAFGPMAFSTWHSTVLHLWVTRHGLPPFHVSSPPVLLLWQPPCSNCPSARPRRPPRYALRATTPSVSASGVYGCPVRSAQTDSTTSPCAPSAEVIDSTV